MLVEFFDGEFQLVAFFQIKPLTDFFWYRDDTTLSDFRVTLHLTHTVPYCINHYNAVGFTLGVKPRGSRLDCLYTIPAGEQVLLSVWSLHRDSRFYDDPLEFDPGRWKQYTPREKGYAFVSFGAGPRICIGRHFSRLEMKAVLATLGRRYRIESESDLAVAPQMTTQPDGPVTVRISERR